MILQIVYFAAFVTGRAQGSRTFFVIVPIISFVVNLSESILSCIIPVSQPNDDMPMNELT